MDEVERRARWPTATAAERYDMLWPRSPAPEPVLGSASGLLRTNERPLDAEAHERNLRVARNMIILEQELAKEAQQAEQTHHDAQAEFRKSAIGQLLRSQT
jgi:hypothetical protein